MIMTQRWKIFAVLASLFLIGFFYRVSMAVAAQDLSVDLGLNAVQLGVLSGIFFYIFALTQIPLGPLLDRYSNRVVLALFGLATTCGALFFALAPGFRTALAGRILLGMGTASVLMGSLKIFTVWFSPQEFPTVSGYMVAAGNLGNLSATAPLAMAVNRFGWRITFVAAAVIQAAITLAVYLVVRDSPPAREAPAAITEETVDRADYGIVQAWGTIFKTPSFWFISLLAFFWYANYMVLLALWGGPYLCDVMGLSRTQAGNVLFFTSLGFVIGSLLLGKIIDKVFAGSLEKTILFGQTLLCVAMTAMLGPAEKLSQPLLMADFFIIGLASSTGVIIYPLARNMVIDRFTATAMTCVNFFLLMGAAVGQHLMGYYIASYPRGISGYPPQAYHGAFLIPVCGLALTLVLSIAFKMGAPKPAAVQGQDQIQPQEAE
jgi:sugar phosphate permease